MKTCFKCGKEKELEEFYRHSAMGDGRLGKCKACTKKDVAENYRKNIEHYVAYEKQRFKSPERKQQLLKYQQSRRIKSPGKYKCHTAVSNAIKDGKLIKQPCEVCGTKAEAHHDDYSKPLDVRWLCRKHHLEHHGKVSREH
jgi:hypothetical protein